MDVKLVRQPFEFPRDNWATGVYESANEAFENLYIGLNKDGMESSPRGLKIKETLGCNIYILNPMNNLVYNSHRLTSPYYLAQEYYWYLSGDRSIESISKYAGFWNRIANNDGTINSNYGAYIFKPQIQYLKDDVSQWDHIVKLLKEDPSSRQAFIQIPIAPFRDTKDVCCTSSFQFFIRSGKLMMITHMRSNDIIKGFCNDITFFCSLQIMLAAELGIPCGWYRHVVGSMHVYENDFLENIDRQFCSEKFEGIYRISTDPKEELKSLLHDYDILRNRESDGLINPIFKYMVDNFEEAKGNR